MLDKYKPVMKGLMTAREMASITKERSRRNGTMELESKEGEGSKFTLRISFRIDPVFENEVSKRNIQT